MDEQQYRRYMSFESPEANPWREGFLSLQLKHIGAVDSSVSAGDVQSILLCYSQERSLRSYHGSDHAAFVGQPDVPKILADLLSARCSTKRAEALLVIAGLFHDVSCKHVDAIDEQGTHAWASVLRDRIGRLVEYTRVVVNHRLVFRTRLTEAGKNDPVTRMVAQVFDVGEQGIIHGQGGNEFDSALAAAKFLEEKLTPPASIVAVVVMIAATIPFRSAIGNDGQGNLTDGYMGFLADRLKSTVLTYGDCTYQPDWQDVNDVMHLSVHLANRDISPFIIQDNFSNVVNGGREIKKEEIPELRKGVTNIQELVRAAEIERSAPFLYQRLGGGTAPVPPDNVIHIYIARDHTGTLLGVEGAYPPLDVYHAAVESIKRNARLSRDFFRAHETGVVLVASIATMIDEPQAPVPGIVRSTLWHDTAIPMGTRFEQLSKDEMVIYRELMYGKSQRDVDVATPRRSPVSGLILGAAGNAGVYELSAYISAIRIEANERGIAHPFANRGIAERYTAKVRDVIGPENLKTIMTELHRVARYYKDNPTRGNPQRAARLEELCPGLDKYGGT